jgi:hypothetical protein
MKTTMRTWKRLAVGVGLVVLAFGAMRVWNKHDFCQGWSDHYAARAKEFRSEAAKPPLGRDEAKKYLVAADIHDLISRKYAAVASRPWRPYPSYPLITAEEQWKIEVGH